MQPAETLGGNLSVGRTAHGERRVPPDFSLLSQGGREAKRDPGIKVVREGHKHMQ